jgi:predicted nucleic acid-binding protein
MILYDTGYLIALFHQRDELHERAVAWSCALREPAVVTEYVLLEAVNRLSVPAKRARAHALLVQVESDPECEVIRADRRLWSAGVESHRQRADKEWSLTDCVSFVVMAERGIRRPLAYDHHFEQAGFEALLRRDPP